MANVRLEDKKNPSPAGTGKTDSRASSLITDKENTTKSITGKEDKGNTFRQTSKKRNWACVVYPESLPENWLEILRLSGLQVAISPLHDKDTEADGITPKKPHYHVILIYSGPTSFNVVKNLTDELNAPIPVALEAVRGYYRYLTHKDNPEKFQYDEKEIRCLNGFSILDFVELTKTEVLKIKQNLLFIIKSKKITEYADFVDFVMKELSESEFDVATSHTFFFDKYITSYRNQKNIPVSPGSVSDLADEVET